MVQATVIRIANTTAELYWDPFDIEIDTHPYDIWRRMRDEAPVYWNDRHGFFALSRFADVEAASKRPMVFSSAHGTVLELLQPQRVTTGMMIFMDPPAHTAHRTLVSRAFTPRRITSLEPRIRQICAELLDPQVGAGGFDFVQDFGARLPSMVISSLLGVPPEDQEAVRDCIDRSFHIEPGVGMINDYALRARIELFEYINRYVNERLEDPRDDMLSDLVRAEVVEDGVVHRLTPNECAEFANLLISAGTETVARLLGWAACILDQHPAQRAELAADPGLLPNAVEELLRYEAPSPVQARWCTEDVELHGTTIPKDSKVVLVTASAGRDEREYPDPDRFDIHRQFDTHLSLGYGIHFCLGAALARMEGRIALEEALKRFPDWEVDHEGATRLHTSTVRGWINVPVAV